MVGPPVESLTLATSDGWRLEAELAVATEPWAAVLLCHPHPTQGGSMRSIVTGTLFQELPRRGVVSLRFNFRGVGASTGVHDAGGNERIDIVAGLDALHPIVEGMPLVVSGWSFGADTSLAVTDSRIDGWAPVAPPLRVTAVDEMVAATDPRPKRLLVPEHDQFRNPESVRACVSQWTNTTVTVANGADHFLVGRLDAAADHVEQALNELAG